MQHTIFVMLVTKTLIWKKLILYMDVDDWKVYAYY